MYILKNNDPVMQEASRMTLRIRHFARGSYPEAGGEWAALPVNRFFIPLQNPSGEACFIADEKNFFPLKPGCAYFIPLHHPARVKLDENLEFISIHFTLEIFETIDIFSHCRTVFEVNDPAWQERAKRAFAEPEVFRGALLLRSLTEDFAAETGMLADVDALNFTERFADFQMELKYIQTHCRAGLSVAEVAKRHGWSREAFSREFSRQTGLSPKQFISRQLLNHACQLLQKQHRVRETAFELGFSNEFYFSRFFKKHTGLSPKEYCRMYRK